MWDQRYSGEDFAYGTTANDFLRSEYARIPQGGHVLCLAEGEGRNAVFLARQGYVVTAVDQSAVGLKKAENLAAEYGVKISIQITDLDDYDLGSGRWDGIVSISAHLPPLLRKKVHAQMAKSLKDDGILILEAYTADQLEKAGIGGPPPSSKELFMSLETLRVELVDLKIIIGGEVIRELSEGKYHQGESAVVQVIACKAV